MVPAKKKVSLPVFPSMQCDDGCGQCCGPFGLPEADYQATRRFVREKGIRVQFNPEDPMRCPFYQDQKCAIYEARPLVCRAFGHDEALPCPRGYNVNVAPGIVETAMRARGRITRTLHELVLEQFPNAQLDLAAVWRFITPPGREAPRVPDRKR